METSVVPSSSTTSNVNTNQCLYSVLLNDFNNFPWSRVVSLALKERSKIDFIDKSNVTPDIKSAQYKYWFLNNQMGQS